MKISQIRAHHVAVDRIYNTRVAPAGGHGEGKEKSDYLLYTLITEDGLTGIGEISDIENDWVTVSAEQLEEWFGDFLIGADLKDRAELTDRLKGSFPSEMKREQRMMLSSSLEMALLDLEGRRKEKPVCELLGGRVRDSVNVSWVIYIRSSEQMEDEVKDKIAEGFTAFKMKVGEDIDEDLQRVNAFREIAGADAYLKLDASGEWEELEAIENVRQLAELGADAIETPIRQVSRNVAKHEAETINRSPDAAAQALGRVRAAVPIPVIEHVADFADDFAQSLIQHRSVDVFNIIPCQAGGLVRAGHLAQIAESAGIASLIGSTIELGPGTAAAIHLAAASESVTIASDLVGPGLLEGDVVKSPFQYTNGRIHVPHGAGLGIELDPDKLERWSV